MSPEIVAAIVACLLGLSGLIAAVTAWVKAKTESERIRSERVATKATRDNEARDLRDQILHNTWEINRLKDQANHNDTLVEDLRSQVAAVNSEVARALVKLDDIAAALKELKK